MTTHGHFYRRYSGGSGSSRSTAADSSARSLSASIEPSTCGTSWNSVRWNKPMNLGYTHSSRISAMFNKPSTSTTHSSSSYSAPPAQRRPYKPLDSLNTHTQPSFVHSTRTSRPTRQDVPYRTRETSRDLFSPTRHSSREVNDIPEKKCSYRSYYWHEPIKPVGVVKLMTIREDSSYLKSRMSLSAPRDLYSTSASSRYSPRSSDVPTSARLTAAATDSSRGRSLSAFATASPSAARLMSPPKAERPWRQKLAEAARLRNLHGDEVANAIGPKIAAHRANRRNSLTRNSESELESSLTALKSLVCMDKNSAISKYREKTGSAAISNYISSTPFAYTAQPVARPSRMAESYNEGAAAAAKLAVQQEENGPMSKSYSPLGSTTTLVTNAPAATPSENNCQSLESVNTLPTVVDEMTTSVTRRKRSPSARTARRESRHRSMSKSQSRQPSPSSSEGEVAQNGAREPPRVKRLKKKKQMVESEEKANGTLAEPQKTAENPPPPPPPTTTAISPPIRAEPAVVVEKEPVAEPSPPQPISAPQNNTPVIKTPSSPKIGPKTAQSKAAEAAKASPKSSPVLAKKAAETPKQNGTVVEKPKSPAAQKKVTEKPASPKTARKASLKGAEAKKEPEAKKETAKAVEVKKAVPKTAEPKKVEPKVNQEVPKAAEPKKVESKANQAVPETKKTANGPVTKVDGVTKFTPKKAAPKTDSRPATPKTTTKKVANGKTPETKAENLTEDESKYSGVAHFVPSSMRKKEEKLPAPVPGTWKGPQSELYISHNKHLKRNDETAKTEGVMKARPAMVVKSPKIKVAAKKKPPPPVTKTIQKTLTSKKANQSERCVVNIPPQERTAVSHKFKLKEKEPKKELKETASATVSPVINAFNKSAGLKVAKTFKEKGKQLEKVSFTCEASKTAVIEMTKELKRKAVSAGAKVTVLASLPLLDVNIARLAMKFKMPQTTKKNLTNLIDKQTALIEEEKKKFIENGDLTSKAQKMLQKMRESFDEENCYASNDHIPSFDYRPGEPIVLPDQSILEEYVRRKRGKLERLQRGASVDSHSVLSDSSACDTPSIRSTTSELLPACAVRVVEPPQKALPLITTPSRSRLSSVEKTHVTPPPRDADMLELLQYGEQVFNANGSAFRAPLRKPQRSASLTKPIFFDAPLTPFEERMQTQANALRKTSNRLDDSSDTSVDVTLQLPKNKRHSASEVSDPKMTLCGVAQNFTNAAALAQQPRYERYAAHIPINRSASSTVANAGGGQDGRQSTTSMESANSAILDTASKQLDQMIDQARYRHHQHRTKFKEAIDYLDQIFEDLKRECDHSNEPQKGAQKNHHHPQQHQQPKQIVQQKNREPQQQRAAPVRRNPQPYQQRFLQDHQSQPVVYTHPIQQIPKQNGNAFTANAEVEVSETIVLPPKKLNNEKMDFTRKWLDGDTKMWTGSEPKPDLIMGRDSQCESDERSIGSCSAEVAAINASDRQKKQRMRETPDLIQNVTNGGQKRRKQPPPQQHKQQPQPQQQIPAPVRPQPCRPQPTYAIPTTSSLSGSSGQLNITPYSSFSACHPIKRVPSQDQFSHYGSLHSEERYKPDKSGSAFLQYKQHGQNIRGSIQSLPDAGLMKTRKPDLMSIDALVAELELNTDEQQMNGNRRSFPVNEDGSRVVPKFNSSIDYEEPKHVKMNRLGHLNGHVVNGAGNSVQTGSVDRGMRRLRQRQQENLDDVTHHMLNNAVTDFSAPPFGNRTGAYHRAPAALGAGLTPFETINTERLNPSKVNAIQSMFEPKKSEASTYQQPQWRRNVVHPNANPQPMPPKEEDTYYEINEFCTRGDRKGSLKQNKAATNKTGQETAPIYPLTQPPAYPPGCNSSTNSSQHGYYSSGSPPSAAAPARHSRQGSFQGSIGGTEGRKHSMVSSRATSFDEEDDGFYDNIVTAADDRRHSRMSDMDNASLMSHRLPPSAAAPQQQSKSGRFGQFLRKIGGHSSRPPQSASSLMSLNKVSMDAKRGGGGQLMKSNSLSNEPWNSQVISASRSSTPDQKRNGASNNGSVGLGQRLKSSFFGSRKRLN
ncbi:hypothetical protein QR680_010306 [Steinernema hermaphroditum]|uniref:Uncharacterized protein n=1 Tax=Steinernema hermaphroditum TaxID=289476 RepID=A0AA39INI5_9BILA|nr:hypothetical protein QR680_010306 [Steinernema hermaphroditum]